MPILLLIGTFAGGCIGFKLGLVHGWAWSAISTQLGATAGVLVAAAIIAGR